MSDLERAREILAGYPLETAQHVIAEALAAARRGGAEEMRERAAAAVAHFGFTTAATFIRALPLTPEDP